MVLCCLADTRCEELFLQAEGMMEMSNRKEEAGDIHTALVYCNQAIGKTSERLRL